MQKLPAYLQYILPSILLNGLLLCLAGRICEMKWDDQLQHAALLTTLFLILDLAERRALRSVRSPKSAATYWLFGGLWIVRDLLVTPLYILSSLTYANWAECFRPIYLFAPWNHIQGLALSFGPIVYLLVILGLVIVGAWCTWKIRNIPNRISRMLHDTPQGGKQLGARPDIVFLIVAVLLLNISFITNPKGLSQNTSHDPVFSFYFSGISKTVASQNAIRDRETDRIRSSYPTNTPHRKADVIIFVVDSLRPDHLPIYGYTRETSPFLSSFIRREHMGKIDTAISVGNYTKAGVFGILSSRFASRQYPDAFKINEVLKKQGYVCRVIASGDQTEFYDMTPYYGHDFDLISDGRLPSEFSINDDERIISTLKSLPERGATPGFFYIHLMSVHHLGYVREEFNKWKTANPTRSETKRDNSDNGILQADDIIRRSIEILKNKGYLSDYLLFITSDHGVGLGEHNHFNNSIFLYSEDISIPLLWKDSKLETTPSYSFATQVDIAPTILGQLGLPIPAGWDGIHFSATPRPLFYVSSPYRNGWRAVINPSKNKEIYLYLQHEKDRVSEQLYSLADDPRELHDLIGHISPEQLSTWRAAGDSFLNE